MGQVSGATGVVKTTVVFDTESSNPKVNETNTVYNLVLSNYVGEFVAGEEIVPDINPRSRSSFRIAADEIVVTRVDLADLGRNYTEATVEFSEPDLPGGTTATAEVKIAKGMVYEINITDPGSGYIKSPSISINSADGVEAEARVRFKDGRPGVVMGVATSDDATVPTTFRFRAPVYLLGNTYYGFVVKSPNSLDYTIWTSKLGENLLNTDTRVVEQPSLGSIFKSQNGGLWTEDQTEDVKFVLKRADFRRDTSALIKLNNSPLPGKLLPLDPIETNANPGFGIESDVFGDNPQIIKVYHPAHGLAPNDLVKIKGIDGDIGGIPLDEINTLHTVIHASLNTFTVMVDTPATESVRAGGTRAYSSYNRPYEVINVYAGLMAFGTSQMTVENRATEHAGVTLYNQPYQYRLDTPRNIKLMDSFYYTGARQVADQINEVLYRDSLHLQGRRSLETTIDMITTNSKVSPVIDLERTNATVVRNLIDNPKPEDAIYGVTRSTITFEDDFTGFDVGDVFTFNNGDGDLGTRVEYVNTDTKKIRVKGKFASALSKSSVLQDALSGIGVKEIVQQSNADEFIPETRSNASTYSKWISRLFLFENLCDGVEVKLSCIFYDNESIKVYFRPKTVGFDFEISNTPWIPFNETGLANGIEVIKPRSSDNVDPNIINSGEWKQLTWSTQDRAKFDGIQLKIVMTADNPAQAPLIDDLQMVVSE